MTQINLIPINTEVELTEDWSFNYTVSWHESENTILQIVGAMAPFNTNGTFVAGSIIPIVIPRGVRILIRKYDLNQGNVNGRITVTIRINGRSPKVKVNISEINKIVYNAI